MAKRAELVFIPAPGFSHLVAIAEFAKLLLERDERFSAAVLVMETEKEHANPAYHSRLRFIHLPHVEPPPSEHLSKSYANYLSEFIESHRACVKAAIVQQYGLPNLPHLTAIVLDFFCHSLIDVANELSVPSYSFLPFSAAFLGFLLHLPPRHDQMGLEFEEVDPESIIPGYINPVPANVLPNSVFNKDGGYIYYVNVARRCKETKGILVNTFLDLESHALSSLSALNSPLVYAVGPVLKHKNQKNAQCSQAEQDEILKWLDDQPPSSVLFLCFGSRYCLGVPQLKELALALEQSEQRFLWCLTLASKQNRFPAPWKESDLKVILPEGFLEKTRNRGLICGWAPQVEVLAHRAVGGFVSHCGWNSILESLWHGVPIVSWPLAAEQQMNAFEMVRDLELAVELKLDYRIAKDSIVKAEEIAKALKLVMEADSAVRKRVKDISMKSREAMISGGSSFNSVGLWIEALLEGK